MVATDLNLDDRTNLHWLFAANLLGHRVADFDDSAILTEFVVAIPLSSSSIFAKLFPLRVADFLINIAAIGLGLGLWGSMAYNSKEEKVEKDEHLRPRRQFSDLRPPRRLFSL